MAGRRTYRTKAVVLGRTKLGEQDLILDLLTVGGGEARVVAKGARKPGGRLAARVELFSETDFLVARGRSLDVVGEATLVDAHEGIRGDMERVAAASAMAEVARLTTFDDVEDAFLYPVLVRALRACEEAQDQAHLDLAVAAYALKVLAHGGWRPELGACVACGDLEPTYFSVAAGGLLCASCARDVEGAEEVAPSQVAWIRACIGLTFDQLMAAEIDGDAALFLLGVAHMWAATHLDARLKAFEFCLGSSGV